MVVRQMTSAQVFSILYVLLTCLGAGTLLVQGGRLCLAGDARPSRGLLVVAACSAVAAFVCYALRVTHPERFIGALAHPTTGITLFLYSLILVAAMAVVALVVLLRSDDDELPTWCSVLCVVVGLACVFFLALGFTLGNITTLTVRFWILFLLFLGDAILVGILLCMFAGARGDKDEGRLRLVALVAALICALGMALYLAWASSSADAIAVQRSQFSMNTNILGGAASAQQTGQTTVSALLGGSHALLFWGGAVLAGVVIPAAAQVVVLVRRRGKAGAADTAAEAGEAVGARAGAVSMAVDIAALVCAFLGQACFAAALQLLA